MPLSIPCNSLSPERLEGIHFASGLIHRTGWGTQVPSVARAQGRSYGMQWNPVGLAWRGPKIK